jgi:quercetin dioxygenase-like cupin family protein
VEHTPAEDIRWEPAPDEHFTGRVWFGLLDSPRRAGDLNALAVMFEPGARTDWHEHPGGQVLYITAGAGFVQRRDGFTAKVSAGDVVYAPAGEVHWHGATPATPMTHLSLTTGGATAWLVDKVTDEEYQSGTDA